MTSCPTGSLPQRLALLPGLRWRGHLKVISKLGALYQVAFDAEVVDPKVVERFVFDRTSLTAKQLKDWTGWEETP